MKMRSSVRKCSSSWSFCSFNSSSRLSVSHQLLGVLAQHFGHGHLDRPIVPDDDDAAGDGHLAIGEGVQRIHQLLRADAARRFDFDLDFFGREIVDGL